MWGSVWENDDSYPTTNVSSALPCSQAEELEDKPWQDSMHNMSQEHGVGQKDVLLGKGGKLSKRRLQQIQEQQQLVVRPGQAFPVPNVEGSHLDMVRGCMGARDQTNVGVGAWAHGYMG